MENKTIMKIARSNNLHYEKAKMQDGYTAYLFRFDNSDEFFAFLPLFRACKNLFVADHFYSLSAYIWDKKDHDAAQELSKNKSQLVDLFFETMRNGGTAEDGKQAQIDFCALNPEYTPAFNVIYC